jgi:uncharacterized membrane protein YhaH (DUF805 family)
LSWYLEVLKKYVVFDGRAGRPEFWYFTLFNVIIYVVLSIIDSAIGMRSTSVGLLSGLYILAVFLPSLGVAIRRLHDTDRSGWWVLIELVPLVGGIILIVLCALEGTPGENQYGSKPAAAPATA